MDKSEKVEKMEFGNSSDSDSSYPLYDNESEEDREMQLGIANNCLNLPLQQAPSEEIVNHAALHLHKHSKSLLYPASKTPSLASKANSGNAFKQVMKE